jgi:hypothetical protein
MRLAKFKLFAAVLTLILGMGVFHATAYACQPPEETLTVNAVWVDGEMLRINVTDADGNTSALAMRLSDYVNDAENQEYISIQAADLMGNVSGIIRVRNPFFDPTAAPTPTPTPPPTEAAIPNYPPPTGGMRPLTPDGTGTVVDNAHGSDGIEFFTIGTEDGNVFYLIIDRQRSTDNVYLLNAVTEEDLISLAQAGGREVTPSGIHNNVDAIPTPEQPNMPSVTHPPSEPSEPDEPEDEPPAAPATRGNDNSMLIIIGIAVLAVGGAGYYFKIVRPKQNAIYDDEDEDDAYGYEDESDAYDDEDGEDR